MSAAKLLGKRTHQITGLYYYYLHNVVLNKSLGRLNVSELFFEVPRDHAKPSNGSLRLFARSVERFERPVDVSKKQKRQLPW